MKLYGWVSEKHSDIPKYNPETGEELNTYHAEFDGILAPQTLQDVLLTINNLHTQGYEPVGPGTMHPEVVLPNKTGEILEQWK